MTKFSYISDIKEDLSQYEYNIFGNHRANDKPIIDTMEFKPRIIRQNIKVDVPNYEYNIYGQIIGAEDNKPPKYKYKSETNNSIFDNESIKLFNKLNTDTVHHNVTVDKNNILEHGCFCCGCGSEPTPPLPTIKQQSTTINKSSTAYKAIVNNIKNQVAETMVKSSKECASSAAQTQDIHMGKLVAKGKGSLIDMKFAQDQNMEINFKCFNTDTVSQKIASDLIHQMAQDLSNIKDDQTMDQLNANAKVTTKNGGKFPGEGFLNDPPPQSSVNLDISKLVDNETNVSTELATTLSNSVKTSFNTDLVSKCISEVKQAQNAAFDGAEATEGGVIKFDFKQSQSAKVMQECIQNSTIGNDIADRVFSDLGVKVTSSTKSKTETQMETKADLATENKGLVDSAGSAYAEAAKGLGQGFSTAAQGAGSGISTASTGVGTGIGNAATGIGTGIGNVFGGMFGGSSMGMASSCLCICVIIIAVLAFAYYFYFGGGDETIASGLDTIKSKNAKFSSRGGSYTGFDIMYTPLTPLSTNMDYLTTATNALVPTTSSLSVSQFTDYSLS